MRARSSYIIVYGVVLLLFIILTTLYRKRPEAVPVFVLSANVVLMAVSTLVFIYLRVLLSKLDHKSLEKPIASITLQFILYIACFMFNDLVQILRMTTSFLTCEAVPTLVVELLFIIAYTAPVLYILHANYATLKQE